MGNRILQHGSGTITTRTFNAANAQLTSTPASGAPTTSSFDPNGNLVQENTGGSLVSMTWDGENRMLSYASASTSESYLYSQDGYRKKKTNSSGTTLFTWDEANNFIETDASLNFQTRRTDFPGYWGGLSFQEIDGFTNIPLFDSQGTTRFAYWFTGSSFFASAYILDAFGNLLSTLPAQPNPIQFDGRFGYYTDATGLIYVRDRIYDPVNGRFISRDPIGLAGGDWGLYQYVRNHPTVIGDPSGLGPNWGIFPIPCPGKGAVGKAKKDLCKILKAAGVPGITATGCLTGPIQAKCLVDFCGKDGGDVYCVSDQSFECNSPTTNCAFSLGEGGQYPWNNVYLCMPRANSPACAYGGPGMPCSNSLRDEILHEVIGNCGTQHTSDPDPKKRKGKFEDPCESRAECLCAALGI